MIEVDDLKTHYGNVSALAGLSLDMCPGKVTGFHVPNSAGKTTTMRIICGLDAPTSGAAFVGGRRYQEMIRLLHEVGPLLDANAVHLGRSAGFPLHTNWINTLWALDQHSSHPRHRWATTN